MSDEPDVVLHSITLKQMNESLTRVAEKLGIVNVEQCDVLPMDRLRQLAEHGVILSVMTFEDHMNPTVHWIEPAEFGIAFENLVAAGRIEGDTNA